MSDLQSASEKFGDPPTSFVLLQVWRYRKLRFLGFGRRKAVRCVRGMVRG